MVVAVVVLGYLQAFLVIHQGLLMISVFAENKGDITVELCTGLVMLTETFLCFLEGIDQSGKISTG